MAGSKIRGITIELSADASGVLDAVKDINRQIKDTSSQMKDVNKLLKLDPGNMTLLSQKTQLLQQNIANTKTKLQELKQAQADMDANGVDKNSAQYQALQREIIATEQELKALQGTAGSGSAALAKVSQVTGEIGDKMETAGKKLSVLSAALTAIGVAAVKAFEDYDEGLDNVIKKTGATGDAAEELEEVYRQVAQNIVADFADIGDAVGEVSTRFHLTGSELEGLTEQFLMFAEINNMDVNSAIEGVDQAMKTFGLSAEDAEEFMGLLTATCQDTGISMDELLGLLQSAGPTFKEMGLDVDDAITLMGAFEEQGIDASDMMSKMSKAAAYFNERGMDMNEGLQDLIERLQNSETEAEATAEAYEIFGKKGGLAFITAAKEGKLSLDDLGASMDDYSTVVEDTYKETLDGTDKMKLAWQNMQVGLASLGETIGNTLAPIMDKITAGIQKVVEWFNGLDEGTRETIVTIGMLVAAIGPLLVIGGKVMKGISSITSALSKIGSVSLGPIGIAITAIAALTAAGVALFDSWENAYKESSPFTEALEELKQANDDLAESMANTMANYESTVEASEAQGAAAEGLYAHLQNLIAGYDGTDASAMAIQSTVEQLNQLVPGLGLAWDEVTNSLNLTTAEVYANIDAMKAQARVAALQEMYTDTLKEQYYAQKNVTDSAKTLKGVLDQYGVSLEEVIIMMADGGVTTQEAIGFLVDHGIAMEDAEGYALELCEALKQYTEATENKQQADENAQFAEDELAEAMQEAAATAQESAQTVVDSADQINEGVDFTEAEQTAAAAGQDIPQEMAAGMNSQSGQVEAAADNLESSITDEFSTTPSEMQETGSDSGSSLASGVTGEVKTVEAALDKLHGLFKTQLNDIGEILSKEGSRAGKSLGTSLSNSSGSVTTAITTIKQNITTQMGTLPSSMYSVGSQAGQGLYNGLSAWSASLSSLANSIANNINAAARRALQIKSPSRVMMQVGEYAGEGLALGLQDSAGEVVDTATQITQRMISALSADLNTGISAMNANTMATRQAAIQSQEQSSLGSNAVIALLNKFLPEIASDKNIYFDDGTWAGKLTPYINDYLETKAIRASRG